ncbi:MAG TPA: hypothetical protein VNA22_05825 [Pyrinomonadaceae bacterium]|nr:hypothetical protein [Pyrinomonadaceae bacterium]
MVKTAVEIARCGGCGADVRDESLFCYNCGAAVGKAPETASEPVPEPAAEKPLTADRPPLRTAASMRKQRRAFNRQPVKVSWEQPEGSPKAFVVTTIVLALGAAVLLVLALYLR